ncbi:hypothetical protein HD554DRAFT_211524 [Boletus coccyginus]|nr:hypothetical protein HD554DRAFT_211524 [Boletus coccyginus]
MLLWSSTWCQTRLWLVIIVVFVVHLSWDRQSGNESQHPTMGITTLSDPSRARKQLGPVDRGYFQGRLIVSSFRIIVVVTRQLRMDTPFLGSIRFRALQRVVTTGPQGHGPRPTNHAARQFWT